MKVPKLIMVLIILAPIIWWLNKLDKHDDWVHYQLNETFEQFEENSKAKKIAFYKLRLDSLTNFEWDSVVYFENPWDSSDGKFTNRKISEEIGIKVTGRNMCDRCVRLIFLDKGEMVSFVDLDPKHLQLYMYGGNKSSKKENSMSFPKNDATFIVFESCWNGQYSGFKLFPASQLESFEGILEKSCYQ